MLRRRFLVRDAGHVQPVRRQVVGDGVGHPRVASLRTECKFGALRSKRGCSRCAPTRPGGERVERLLRGARAGGITVLHPFMTRIEMLYRMTIDEGHEQAASAIRLLDASDVAWVSCEPTILEEAAGIKLAVYRWPMPGSPRPQRSTRRSPQQGSRVHSPASGTSGSVDDIETRRRRAPSRRREDRGRERLDVASGRRPCPGCGGRTLTRNRGVAK